MGNGSHGMLRLLSPRMIVSTASTYASAYANTVHHLSRQECKANFHFNSYYRVVVYHDCTSHFMGSWHKRMSVHHNRDAIFSNALVGILMIVTTLQWFELAACAPAMCGLLVKEHVYHMSCTKSN